jgi:hypothetical protein
MYNIIAFRKAQSKLQGLKWRGRLEDLIPEDSRKTDYSGFSNKFWKASLPIIPHHDNIDVITQYSQFTAQREDQSLCSAT